MHRLDAILFPVLVTAALSGAPSGRGYAAVPSPEEMSAAEKWTGARFRSGVPALPFSFTYGGRPSLRLLPAWEATRLPRVTEGSVTRETLTLTDPKTGLAVRCEIVGYRDFPTVEWTLYFKNTGTADTPILEDIRALDVTIPNRDGKDVLLHHAIGSPYTPTDYRPLETALPPGTVKRITTSGGRPTNSDLPCFNIETGGGGMIAVLGWPGQWAADFVRDPEGLLRVSAGQESTRFLLHPGEEVRSPLVVLQFYSGDWIRGQNIWRRWMWAHNVPRPGGKPLVPQCAACSSHQYAEMINANTESQKLFIDRYIERGIRLDYWWMDAGWYWNEKGWPQTGTWEVDTNRFPGGLRVISDYARARGIRTIVWFEPERVGSGSWLATAHRDWLYGRGVDGLLNIGKPETWTWLVNHFDSLIVSEGVDLYRQDFNIDPLMFWQANDTPDRQGISEIRHVTAYLAYWDELRRRHPELLIDSCASGGRRNDLETLRRGVPLLRSDWIIEPVSQQNHTYGIAFWIPFYGTGINQFDAYGFRSCMCPHVTFVYDMRLTDQDYAPVVRLFRQWREEIAPNFWGDYYPLTPFSPDSTACMAFQFDRPEEGSGVVLAFRRAHSPDERLALRLRGLEPGARYTVRDLDTESAEKFTGRSLMDTGLAVVFRERPGSAALTYRKEKP